MKVEVLLVVAGATIAMWWVTRHRETMAALAPTPPPIPFYDLRAQATPTGGLQTSAGFLTAEDIALVSQDELDEFLASLL